MSQLEIIASKQVPSSSLLYLLPPCILLAVDIAVRLSKPPMAAPAEDQVLSCPLSSMDRVKLLGRKAQEVLSTFSQLEGSLSSEGEPRKAELGTLQRQRNFAHHRRRLAVYTARQGVGSGSPCRPAEGDFSTSPTSRSCMHPHGVSKPFTNFCEKLLLQNRIWKQQKEIGSLKRTLESTKSTNASHAFQSFCDRLLMSNNIWKLEREVEQLKEDGEKLKRSRVAAVTRAAKQMVQDVRKERLTEEYVKDLLDEMDGYRRAVVNLRAEHEKEIAEMAEEFRKDSRRMSMEIERLQLAQEARRIEQDLSNDIEEELLARLGRQSPADRSAFAEEESAYAEDDMETLDGDSDCDSASNLSTSTFVGSGPCTPNDKFAFVKNSVIAKSAPALKRRSTAHPSPLRLPHRTISMSSLRSDTSSPATATVKTPVRRVDPAEYVGFSFNPLFFGKATISRTEDGVKVESPAVPNPSTFSLMAPPAGKKAITLASKASTTSLKGKQPSLIPQQRTAWRV